MKDVAFLVLAVLPGLATADTVTYHGDVFPEEVGWERRLADTFGAERSLNNGWLLQFVDLPAGWPGPMGNAEFYRRSLEDFAGAEAFFLEWRVETDAPRYILDRSGVPVVVSLGGTSTAHYHTTITDTRVQLFRDTAIPLAFVDIAPGEPHTYRLELRGSESYAWFVDGVVVDTGVPEGTYPNPDSTCVWGVRRHSVNATTRWDYVSYGVIPEPATGFLFLAGAAFLVGARRRRRP